MHCNDLFSQASHEGRVENFFVPFGNPRVMPMSACYRQTARIAPMIVQPTIW